MCEVQAKNVSETIPPQKSYEVKIIWFNVLFALALHLAALYGAILFVTDCKYLTTIHFYIVDICNGVGIIVGAHRLWSHRAFKAKLPLQIILAVFQTLSFQDTIYEWARDHRGHHKFCDTDADPHNSTRGFFYSHVGWLLTRKGQEVIEKGKTIDMSDLDKDPVVQFQKNYYLPLTILIWFIIPAFIPYYFWNESLSSSIFICVFLRTVVFLNITWIVNSGCHMWGMRPYDKNIHPREFVFRSLIRGEGFHNYHHTFPWDYSASEHGASKVYNPCTVFINTFEKIGWAYDLKKMPEHTIKNKVIEAGDSTYSQPSTIKDMTQGFLVSNSYFIALLFLKFYL